MIIKLIQGWLNLSAELPTDPYDPGGHGSPAQYDAPVGSRVPRFIVQTSLE